MSKIGIMSNINNMIANSFNGIVSICGSSFAVIGNDPQGHGAPLRSQPVAGLSGPSDIAKQISSDAAARGQGQEED